MYMFKGANFSFPLNQRTYILGILNITPDSFFDGGKWNEPEIAIRHALQMQKNGADIIDVGAQSTRPGHIELTDDEELSVLKQFLPSLLKNVSIPISVDTFYPKVAQYALENGASIINDVSGIFNPEMAKLIQKYNAGWIVMHSGKSDSDSEIIYPNGVVEDVLSFFGEMKEKSMRYGISSHQLCFDLGIGFGKSHADNLTLIREINRLKSTDSALLTALSCKRMVAYETNAEGEDRLFGTIAADTLAIAGGTDFIRVHHVKEAKLAAKMADVLTREK